MYTCPLCSSEFDCREEWEEHVEECSDMDCETTHESMRKTRRMPWEER